MATIQCLLDGKMGIERRLEARPSLFKVRPWELLLPIVAAATPVSVALAETKYGVDIDVGVIRSDNIFLDPKGEEQSETLYTIAPEFHLKSDERRFEADIRYKPEAVFYSKLDESDQVYHMLDAGLTSKLVKEKFFLDLRASSFQSIVTPDAQAPGSNFPITQNRTDTLVLEARPYWQQRIGQANLLIEGRYVSLDYPDSDLQSSNERHGYFQIGNIKRQQGFAWQANYRYRRTEYEISTPWEFQRAALNLGAWISSSTRLFVEGGAETSFDNLFEPNMDSDFWEAGIQYVPNQRMNLEIAVGDRSYGTSYRGEFGYQMHRGDISISYSEGPSNRSELAFSQRPPLGGNDDLDGIANRPGDSDRFVRKRGELRLSTKLVKSDLSVRIFSESREARTTATGEVLDDESLSGVAANWDWRFGNKTTLGLSAELSDRERSGVEDDLRRFRVSLRYKISKVLSARIEAGRYSQEGRDTSNFDFEENQLRFYFRASF